MKAFPLFCLRKRPGNACLSILGIEGIQKIKTKPETSSKNIEACIKVVTMKAQNAGKVNKKTQTFVLRVWDRAEGQRYELRTLAGERRTFKTLTELEEYVSTVPKAVEEV